MSVNQPRSIMCESVPAVLVSLASAGRAAEPGLNGSGFSPNPGVRAPAHDGFAFVAVFGSCRAAFDDAEPILRGRLGYLKWWWWQEATKRRDFGTGMTSNRRRPFSLLTASVSARNASRPPQEAQSAPRLCSVPPRRLHTSWFTRLTMLRSSRALTQSAPLVRKRLFSQASSSSVRSQGRTTLILASTAVAAATLWYATREEIHNDAVATPAAAALGKLAAVTGVSHEDGSLATLVWGSNK